MLAAALLVGCSGELTEAIVMTDTDLRIGSQIDAIRYEVDATQIGGRLYTAQLDLGPDTRFPVTLTLVHDGGPLGPVVVAAEALRGRRVVVRRSARFSFVRGRSLTVDLDLTDACVGLRCGSDETCVDGACRDVDLAPGAPAAPADAGEHACAAGCRCTDECSQPRF